MAAFVVADPAPDDEVARRIDELSKTVHDLESRRSGRGSDRRRLARAEAELAHFEDAVSVGLWNLRLWTAAADATGCAALAAMIGGSADLRGGPLKVRHDIPEAGPPLRWSDVCAVSTEVLTTVLRPPVRELPGVRLIRSPEFDRTSEVVGDLVLGDVLDATDSPSLRFGVPLDSVNRHVLVSGATGSGKSQTVRALLERLTGHGVPWLVIEPAKAEYAGMAGRVAPEEVLVIRPGAPDSVPASLNPLEPSSIVVDGARVHFPLQTHVDLLRALFLAAFDAQEPFPQILSRALIRSYEQAGWNLTLGASLDSAPGVDPRWPRLSDLQEHALRAVDDVGYGSEVRQNVRGFVGVRVGSLRTGTPGRFFEGGHPLDLDEAMRRNVVFEIEDLGDDSDKAFFIGCVLMRLFEILRLRKQHATSGPGLAHVTVIEEAHRLLRQVPGNAAAAQAVTAFTNLLAEVRAYGEGIVVAEQIPGKLVPDVVKNSAVKITHRLPAKDDRDFVGATMNLDEAQSQHLVALRPGTAAAHVDGMDRPVLVSIDGSGEKKESSGHPSTGVPVERRGPGCSADCLREPCDLRLIVRAESASPARWVALWAEIAVVAHLIGEPVGGPSSSLRDRLARLPRPLADCVVAHEVETAVDRRGRSVQRWYDPRALTRQVADLLRDQLRGGGQADRPAARWRIGVHRYTDIARALRTSPGPGEDDTRPHPLTPRWELRQVRLAGPTWADQLVQLQLVIGEDERNADPAAVAGDQAGVRALIRELGSGPDDEKRLRHVLTQLGAGGSWAWPRYRTWMKE
ncbi:ATP-binding protein [Amycolatopsis sp. Hca4]|uniref:ATP-binding protein n=1 Tax=Amycolatopsis sp. Hca4 TaxID=2742131 RepID=UPI001591B09B|nr:ATP-binding protein [Amycolatopsis sp. Hca4]QKV75303.1 ATP-binding protein [Amycolatopsis sp. Hca4]